LGYYQFGTFDCILESLQIFVVAPPCKAIS
jgi:hypothetical protein